MTNRLGIEAVLLNLKHINEMPSHQNVFILCRTIDVKFLYA